MTDRGQCSSVTVCWSNPAPLCGPTITCPNAKALDGFRSQDDFTLGKLAGKFLEQQKAVNSKGTFEYYRSIIEGHIYKTSLAQKPVGTITANDISMLLGQIRHAGFPARANKVRQTLSTLFNFAIADHLADENPVRRTKPVRTDSSKDDDIDPFTENEIGQVIQAAKPGWERRLVLVAFGTGLRAGELFGLKRQNVDLAAQVIYVRQSLSRFGEGPVKTKRSRRTVHVAETVAEALREQLDEAQLKSEWLWQDTYHRKCMPHNPHNFSRRSWPEILRRAQVKHREFYQCRHTFATLLLNSGEDVQYIADQMGHANLTMLQKHYWKWKPGRPASRRVDVVSAILVDLERKKAS